jgi:uncharacterized membrane protein YdjX (TVP38/TMEM64 family)
MIAKIRQHLPVLLLILSFGGAVGLVVYIARHREIVEAALQSLGAAGPVISVILYSILAFSPIPADPLTLINGALYGPIWGSLVAWIGMTGAAAVEYLVGTWIGDAAEFEDKRENFPFGLGNLPVDSPWFLLGGRLLTGAGSKIVSYLSGIYRISLWRYFWTSAVSTLFGSVIFTLIGIGLINFF